MKGQAFTGAERLDAAGRTSLLGDHGRSRLSRLRRLSVALTGVLAVGAIVGAAPALATPVTGVTPVTLSSTAAGATGVTYTFGFTTSVSARGPGGHLAAGQAITVAAPAGTVLPSGSSAYALRDAKTNASIGVSASLAPGGGTVTLTITSQTGVAAGESLTLTITGVTNPPPPPASGLTLTLITSADTTPVQTPPYATTQPAAPTSLSSLTSLSWTTSAAGATGVTYAVGFATSSTGALPANQGSITVAAPAGTVFPSSSFLYLLHDSTSSTNVGLNVFISNAGATATLQLTGNVNASDSLTLTIFDVTNPPPPAANALALHLSSSADTAVASTPLYATTPPQALSGLTVSLSSLAPGATGVTYLAAFTTSSTGRLVGGFGSFTIAVSGGTVLPGNSSAYALHDATSNANIAANASLSNGGAIAKLTVAGNVNAGDALTLTITGVTNPGAGVYALHAASSSDTVPATSPNYTIAGPALPPPRSGKAVNVSPVSGTVLVKLPGHRNFTRLTVGEQIPVGSTIDVTHGRVTLVSARTLGGVIQLADFYGGKFTVGQRRGQALTTLKLMGGNFRTCGRHAGDLGPVAGEARRRPRRHLWGSGSGSFSTSGNSASGTVRGTIWLTEDDCEGTLIHVQRGTVVVRDLVRKKTIIVHAPHSYFAHK